MFFSHFILLCGIALLASLNSPCQALPKIIRVGGLFDQDDESQETAFLSAVTRINANSYILPKSQLQAQIERISKHDSFEASKRVCSLMSLGVAAIFGPQSAQTSSHVQSICDALEVPHIETRWDYRSQQDVYSINLYPHPPTLSRAYEDLVRQWEWKKFTIIYENNDGLVRLKDLFKTPAKVPISIILRQLPPGDDYRDMLRELKKLEQRNIIIDCGTDKIFQVLKQAQQVGMITDQHHYLVTSIDMDTIDLEDFRYGGTNITSLRLVDPTRADVVKVVNELQLADRRLGRIVNGEKFQLKTETALMFDAVHLFAKALHDLDSSQHIDIKPLSCDLETPWSPGNSLINYMKVVQLEGLSGIVGFDTNGFRSHFDMDIMELHKSGLEKIGYWSSRYKDKKVIGLNITQKVAEKVDDGTLRSKTLSVTTLLNEPYAMIKESPERQVGNARFEGYCVDLIDEIAKILGFNYTLHEVEDKSYGNRNPLTGEWNGMIRELKDGKADLAIGDITITYQRESAVDFTTPFMNLGISILFLKPTPAAPSLLSFLSPFSMDVWLYMAVTYMGVSVLLFILARISPYEWDNPHPCVQEPDVLRNDFNILNSMWFTIGSLMQQGSDIAPKAASTRLVAGIWWFFTLIMISSYTANLAAFLTVEKMVSPIKDVKDLEGQTKIKYGCVSTGSTLAFFRDSNIPMYQRMWASMSANNMANMVPNNWEGVERVKGGGYAFFIEATTNEYKTERECNLTKIGDLLDNKGYGIALIKGSPNRNLISGAILHLQETGVLQSLKVKWWKQKKGGGQCKDAASAAAIKALGLQNVGGIFVVLLGGVIIATFIAIGEFIWKTRQTPGHERESLCRAMIKELSFALTCKGSKKVERKRPVEPELTLPLSKYSISEREMYS